MDFEKQTIDYQKKAIIALMYKIALEDGELHPGEAYFIIDTANKFELNDKEVDAISSQPEKYPLKVPQSEKERMTILYYLLYLIKFDGIITQGEAEWIKGVGFKFGFRDELTTDFIKLMQKYINQTHVPPNAMLDVIRKFKN